MTCTHLQRNEYKAFFERGGGFNFDTAEDTGQTVPHWLSYPKPRNMGDNGVCPGGLKVVAIQKNPRVLGGVVKMVIWR